MQWNETGYDRNHKRVDNEDLTGSFSEHQGPPSRKAQVNRPSLHGSHIGFGASGLRKKGCRYRRLIVHRLSITERARLNRLIAWICSRLPTSLGALPASARALDPSRMIPIL